MSEYNLSKEDKAHLLQLIGCNTIHDSEGFYQMILTIANESEWSTDDLETLNMLIKDGMGYFLQSIFRDRFQHPLYEKHYSETVFNGSPVEINDLHVIADKLKRGEISIEDLSKYGCKISTLDQFVSRK